MGWDFGATPSCNIIDSFLEGVFNGQKKIPKGSFIGVYAGELITVSEADHRGTWVLRVYGYVLF